MAKFYTYLTVLVHFHLLATSDVKAFSVFSILRSLSAVANPLTFLSENFNISAEQVAEFASSLAFNHDVPVDGIKILLYREYDHVYPYNLNSTNIPLDPNQDIKLIIHGYRSYGSTNWSETISRAYHKINIKNTFAIDWNDLANQGYLTSATSTKVVGHHIANWLFYNLLRGNSTRLRNIHLIGHSLGVHVAGFIGKRICEITKGRYLIGRITGLEAAAPLFEFPLKLSSSFRIDRVDAQIVEGFHTNAGFFGFRSAYGHRDFYISSGGPIQPGCNKGFHILDSLICSHSLVEEIFRRTIESTDYVATKCYGNIWTRNQKIIMGEYSNATDLSGSFCINIDEDINPKSIQAINNC